MLGWTQGHQQEKGPETKVSLLHRFPHDAHVTK